MCTGYERGLKIYYKEKEKINMNNIGTVELESNRLLFRKASTSDSNAMFNNWANDKEVTKYLRWDAYEKEEDTIKFLNYLENFIRIKVIPSSSKLISFACDTSYSPIFSLMSVNVTISVSIFSGT